ncbi:sister chromatid cohesion protein PDS5 homolog A-like isoform X1 [Salvia splendens]|uniref:sister chromatid cohesion protein PDS5 homolog A-like isoform X1 n=1 Tax=Salvia splendens TaxID=180675 RepID=UPI001C273A3D|nr:sister chromatid cohesion protein PDS5 homolog A-like isoform X1 [Salvia splendens]
MAQKLQQQLKELGSKLEALPSSRDALIKLLKHGVTCLTELDQSPPKTMLDSMQSFLKAIVKPELLKHHDQEVKLFVAACICEITRITAPEAPYEDDIMKDIFQLTVSTFSGLSDVNSPSFGRILVILETLARYRSCVVMLDLECDDLIKDMFSTFFTVARDEHPENVITSMQTIMEVLFEESEDVPENLLLTLLSALSCDNKDITIAARRLAMNVVERCAEKLEPGVKQFLVSSMSGDSRSLKPEMNYHAVLYNIYQSAPQILSGVVPYLTGELLSDQLEVRLKAVGLVGDLFSLPESTISVAFQPVFSEFLKRLTDRVAEVRMSVLEHVKSCLLVNPFRPEAPQIISALCDRLLDYEESVRKKVVSVVCDVVCHDTTSIPVETIKLVSERLRDKSLLVKRYTMERLADIYKASCMKQSSGTAESGEFDWIVGKILRCFYDKDFRSDTIEPILSLSLFPTDFPVKDKVKKWVRIFSGFDKVEVKALEKILEQKQRLQQEMHKYLSLKQLSEEGDKVENQKKILFCFRALSRSFTNPAEAEENFQNLDQLTDSNIWKLLSQLLDPNTSSIQANSSRDDTLKLLGDEHRLYEFLSTLSLKCSYLLFDKDHVKEIVLDAEVHKSSGNNDSVLSCMTILVILARFCPLLLHGIEEDLVHFLEDDNEIIKEGTLHILAKAGGTIREQLGVSSRSLDLILERICFEGNRRQAKYAVHALASITKDDGLMSLSVLYKRLVDMLEEKAHMPAVLQSLGCIAQAAMPVFETRESEIVKFIRENILEIGHVSEEKAPESWDDISELCSLKIYGVKALVKSYLPVKDAHLRSGIDDLFSILKNILFFGDISSEIRSSSVDRAHLKLAAAKAVLRLSKYWEHKIPIDVFYLTMRTSEDNFPEIKKLLLNKIHQYVKDRALDPKYSCAFLLDDTSQQEDIEENKRNLNDIILMCRQGRGRQTSSQSDPDSSPHSPEYLLPYVVHSLAHHPSCPSIDESRDVKIFEEIYRKLYLFISMLVHGDGDGKSDVSISKDKESLSLLNSIFLCIKRSEDAFDTTKSQNSYALCDLGMSIVKRFVPNQDDLHDSTASVTLPAGIYKQHTKKDDNDSLVGEEKTWLAEDGVFAHFESLKLKTNEIANSVHAEDDNMKDSETEGSEIPLGKLMKRLKAKAAKARKEAKNQSAPAGISKENDFDILKMVKEINSDNLGTSGKIGSSNNAEHVGKKRKNINQLEKRKTLLDESKDAPVPKRRRTSSAHAHKSLQTTPPKGSKKPRKVNQEDTSDVSDKMDEDLQTSSEDIAAQEKMEESTESDLLLSRMGKKSSASSKQKAKRPGRDNAETLHHSPDAKKPKKVKETEAPSFSFSKSASLKKQKKKSVSGLAKCTSKDSGSHSNDLIGSRIKVWWPMDKKFYEGVIKSFDTHKKKHVIVYDDGDVEVLRLDRERWELVENNHKSKQLGSSKGSLSKGGSSGQKKKTVGGLEQVEKLGMKSSGQKKKTLGGLEQVEKLGLKSLSSQARGKRTPRKSPKEGRKGPVKINFSVGRREKPMDVEPESSTKSLVDRSDSEKEQNERSHKSVSDEELSDNDKKHEEDAESEEPKEGEDDSENTQSDHAGGPPHDTSELDSEAVSASDGKQLDEDKEGSGRESEEADDMDSQPASSDKPDKNTCNSGSADDEHSDDELLSTWSQRAGKK